MVRNKKIKLENYTIKPFDSRPFGKKQINTVWIENDSGEGMEISIDKLWEKEF